MRKLFLAFAALAGIFALPQAARAQTQTYVSGTVTGSDSIAWAGARISASIVSPGGASLSLTPCTSGAGCPVANPATGGVQAGGAFGMNLWANGSILPAGTTYTFTATINGLLPAVGTGPQTCTVTGVTVAGATQTVNLSGCPPLTNIAGGGGGTPCILTLFSIQFNNSGAFGCVPDLTFSAPHTLNFGASGIYNFLGTQNLGSASAPGTLSWFTSDGFPVNFTLPNTPSGAAVAGKQLFSTSSRPLDSGDCAYWAGLSTDIEAYQSGNCGQPPVASASGPVNAMSATIVGSGLSGLAGADGFEVIVTPNLSNTGTAPTFQLNGGPAVTIDKCSGVPLVAGDYLVDVPALLISDGINYKLQNPQAVPCGSSASGTVNATPIHAPVVGAGPGSATVVGPSANCTVPTGNGQYQVLYNVTASAAVDPSCPQVGLSGTAGLTLSTSSYTILYSDNTQVVAHDYAGSSSIAVTLPTPTTLGNAAFVTSYCDYSAHADTITPTTWTINGNSTLPVPTGTCFRISVDPNNAALSKTNWLAIGSGATGGSNVFPMTVSGTVNSGAIPCFNSTTNEQTSVALTVNVLPKGGGAGACPTNSLTTDDGTSSTYTGTGGTKSPSFTATGTVAGFTDMPQGPDPTSTAPCNAATSVCRYSSTAQTQMFIKNPPAPPVIASYEQTDGCASVKCTDTYHPVPVVLTTTSDFTDSTSATLVLVTGLSTTMPVSQAVVVKYDCTLYFDQATTAVVDEIGVGITGTAPTYSNHHAVVWAAASHAWSTTGVLSDLASTTPTSVASFTPSAITTIWSAELSGTIEQPSNATPGVFGVYVYTTTGSDNFIVKRDSACSVIYQ